MKFYKLHQLNWKHSYHMYVCNALLGWLLGYLALFNYWVEWTFYTSPSGYGLLWAMLDAITIAYQPFITLNHRLCVNKGMLQKFLICNFLCIIRGYLIFDDIGIKHRHYIVNYQVDKILYISLPFISCDQAAPWMAQFIRQSLSVSLSVCDTIFTMFPSLYHHEIFCYYQWQLDVA